MDKLKGNNEDKDSNTMKIKIEKGDLSKASKNQFAMNKANRCINCIKGTKNSK